LTYPELGTGQNMVWLRALGQPGSPTVVGMTEVNLNSANIVLTVPLADLGLAEGDQFDFLVQGADWYFVNDVRDAIAAMTFTVGTPRYTSADTVEVPPQGTATLAVSEVAGGAAASPSQTGL